jgi:hypothetical protein
MTKASSEGFDRTHYKFEECRASKRPPRFLQDGRRLVWMAFSELLVSKPVLLADPVHVTPIALPLCYSILCSLALESERLLPAVIDLTAR